MVQETEKGKSIDYYSLGNIAISFVSFVVKHFSYNLI